MNSLSEYPKVIPVDGPMGYSNTEVYAGPESRGIKVCMRPGGDSGYSRTADGLVVDVPEHSQGSWGWGPNWQIYHIEDHQLEPEKQIVPEITAADLEISEELRARDRIGTSQILSNSF